jgi:hypothetical protein
MTPPRSACGAPLQGASGQRPDPSAGTGSPQGLPVSGFGLQGGATCGPAKRLRFSVGSYRASDVTPELKPVPRRPLYASRLIDRRCGPAEH